MSKWFSGRSRGVAAVLVLSASLSLAGCERLADFLPFGGQDETPAGPVIRQQDAAPAAVLSAEPGQGRTLWRAEGDSAGDVTGNLRISRLPPGPGRGRPIALAFAHGVTLRLHPPTIHSSDEPSGSETANFAGLLGLDPDLDVFVYEVEEEVVSSSAIRGGLCGGSPARFLAISEFLNAEGEWTLRMASFGGEARPGGGQGDPGLCRIYSFRAA